ncbi:MAG: AAA family ATPase [Bryobacterales bacterium]
MARLQAYLRNLMQRKTKVVLLFDECQALSFEALEQVRLLSNLRSSNMNLIEVVMAGQLEFEEMLQRPEHEALRQRISCLARIRRFGAEDVQRYIERRLLVAGRSDLLFDPSAVETVAEMTHGIPRNINHLCYKAMALAWADGETTISGRLVTEAAQDLDWVPAPSEDKAIEGEAAATQGVHIIPPEPQTTGWSPRSATPVAKETSSSYTRSSRGRSQAGVH